MNYYCKNCKLNIYNDCLKNHHSHQIISFDNIGLNNNELNNIEKLFKEIETRIYTCNIIKENINFLFTKKINENICENDYVNEKINILISYLKL